MDCVGALKREVESRQRSSFEPNRERAWPVRNDITGLPVLSPSKSNTFIANVRVATTEVHVLEDHLPHHYTMATQRRIVTAEKTHLDQDEKPQESSIAPAVPSYVLPLSRSPSECAVELTLDAMQFSDSEASWIHVRYDHNANRDLFLDIEHNLRR